MSSSTDFNATDKNKPADNGASLPQIVINTRPVERAAPLTQHLQAAGLIVVEMPMLSLQSRQVTDADRVLMRQWLAGDYKALVIVSPTAAASGLAVWQALAHKHEAQSSNNEQTKTVFKSLKVPSALVAVGDATAAALNNVKLDTARYQVRQPKTANNEGMLAMPEIEDLQAGDKLLIWRGLGGRRLLVDTLQARGVHIDSIAWYERTMPSDALTQYQQWLKYFLARNATWNKTPSKPIVVISSGAAFEHWTNIVKEVSKQTLTSMADSLTASRINNSMTLALSDFSYVVLGERLTNMVAEQQLNYWRVDDLAPETILAAIGSKT
ncbi:uroporphyrinogen-III synthase [Psychrobacter aquaticus]|uniref:Uroporphyrinogen-III synthase n=1 Tax=Psychrobacter aquaticus CMS 56 TaxID=1354303 RepID=U4TB56_9GAMM|nr:uroporphyrinogen-III synthase [Psychrobacter aquaticus]ERL55713.1 Uroporphyrinogen-III synthase (UROS) (Uroporphyrinogen-III cosynthetase) (Hydroxymethylbilane hydrolyase [cyclizing]) [Psychrobacter aquaticus CMS 56]